jgi:hypothetical protein
LLDERTPPSRPARTARLTSASPAVEETLDPIEPKSIVAADVTAELQRDQICQRAVEIVIHRYRDRGDQLVRGVLLADEAPSERRHIFGWRFQTHVAPALDLEDEVVQAAALSRYLEIQERHHRSLHLALEANTIDYAQVLLGLKELYRDEDQLALEVGGEDALRRLRFSELDGRNQLTLLAAAFADLSWEDSIGW